MLFEAEMSVLSDVDKVLLAGLVVAVVVVVATWGPHLSVILIGGCGEWWKCVTHLFVAAIDGCWLRL